MCFGSKEKQLYNDSDEAPRPAPGQFPQQPTYADTGPKASMPPPQQQPPPVYYQQQQQPPPPQEPSPISPQYPSPTYPPYAPTSAPTYQAPPAELSSVPHSNPPVELPTSTTRGEVDYAPPPGPPPSQNNNIPASGLDYAPPPGPPPSASKPQHDWEAAVPDTSLFPPPPAIFTGWYESPTSNAPEAEAEAGEQWCRDYPLAQPMTSDDAALGALKANDIRLMTPAVCFKGTLAWTAPGVWSGNTESTAKDSCIIGYPPLYMVQRHSPLYTGAPHTIYYEVRILPSSPSDEICLALGFTALPYPSFRMPGWHRGSLAIHGDDGHKYINDRWGGKSFTQPFKRGDTVGVGMTFKRAGGYNSGTEIATDVFFTRNGQMSGGWDLHEETDADEDLPVTGLEGYHDISCAIGTFKAVGFEVVFDPSRWAYKLP